MSGKTRHPKMGLWFSVKNLTQIADIDLYLQENFGSVSIRAITINGSDVSGKQTFEFTDEGVIQTFLKHLGLSRGIDGFRIIMRKRKLP